MNYFRVIQRTNKFFLLLTQPANRTWLLIFLKVLTHATAERTSDAIVPNIDEHKAFEP